MNSFLTYSDCNPFNQQIQTDLSNSTISFGNSLSPSLFSMAPDFMLPRASFYNLSDDGAYVVTQKIPERQFSYQSFIADQELDLTLQYLKKSMLSQSCPQRKSSKEKENIRLTMPKLEKLRISKRISMPPNFYEVISDLINDSKSLEKKIKSSLPRKIFRLNKFPEGTKFVGAYTIMERLKKIGKYKAKLKIWREKHPISKTFEGRRQVAFQKARLNGRFAKAPEMKLAEM